MGALVLLLLFWEGLLVKRASVACVRVGGVEAGSHFPPREHRLGRAAGGVL